MHIGVRAVPPEVLRAIPEKVVRRHHVFPLMVRRLLLVAASTPADLLLLDEVAFAWGMPVVPALASSGDIAQAIRRHFGEQA